MKKLITSLTAMILTASIATATVASAKINPCKDPNLDGVHSVADATYIEMVLAGKYKPSCLNRLDVNDNGVVSEVDALEFILPGVSGPVTQPCTDNCGTEESIAIDVSRKFYKYNAKTGKKIKTYSLHLDELSSSSAASPNAMDIDDRKPGWSHKGTAKIMIEGGAGYAGTGFVVDKHTIATAAHVVYSEYENAPKKLTEILLFDSDGKETSFTPVEYHFPANYLDVNYRQACDDYALITVKEDMSEYQSFNIGVITDTAIKNELRVETVGFSQSFNNGFVNDGTNHMELLSHGNLKGGSSSTIVYDLYTVDGNSGGPIYTVESIGGKDYYTIIGVHRGPHQGYNWGARFDVMTLKFFYGNTNIYYYD